ncbi:MAG: nitroreductase [Gammaproteobacteria bacterium]|nr:MAG: nitroreductase [Gammaproteobacteria bacterium]
MLGWKKVRPYFRGGFRIYKGLTGFFYDVNRYIRFGGWRGEMSDPDIREYNSAMANHGLEKSLSYKNRNPNSGWKNAYKILGLLNVASKTNSITYHDKASKSTLTKFINLQENLNDSRVKDIDEKLKLYDFSSKDEHGHLAYSSYDFEKGKLSNPESFFYSRFSLREYKDMTISDKLIQRGVKLALKTPSVCNRQPWHIYHTSDKEVILTALKYQSGNRPFGDKVRNLIVVTVDLKAFFGGNEHYQHWIDGGLISMSLMYAFHSLGLATCALNWSQTPKNDKAIREVIDIKGAHTIIMMLAIGIPNKDNLVCYSSRRPLNEFFTDLHLKDKN